METKRIHLFKWLSFLMVVTMVSGLFLSAYPSAAQSSALSANADGDDDFPLYIDITGTVTALSATSITVDNLVITIPSGLTLPAGVTVGATITIHARITDDDVVIAITIVIGSSTPTPAGTLTPTPEVTFTPTPVTTLTPTPAGTLTPTLVVTGTAAATPPIIKGCGLPKAILALYIAQAYNIPLDELEFWHCNGHAYGVIARAYAIVFASNGNTNVTIVLDMHKKGKKWQVIFTDLGVTPKPDQSTINVKGGKTDEKACPPGLAKKGACGPSAKPNNGKPPKKNK
jgi:hypothetical protein